jgi:hypothetical protein
MNRNLALLKTLLAHVQDVPAIVANVRDLAAGPEWVAHRAEPSHNLIELTYPIFDEVDELLTTASALSARELEAEMVTVKNQATALGLDWLELVNTVVPVILQVYELLRALRNKQPIPAPAG